MTARIVYITAGSAKEAGKLAHVLVEERLAACVSIIPKIRSVYRWKGRVEKSQEWLLIIKTTASRVGSLSKRVRQLHSYDVPEIIALAVVAGSSAYLQWLHGSVTPKGKH